MSEQETKMLREELIRKMGTGHDPLDAELGHLRMIVEGEQERVRRLARRTKQMWMAAAMCAVLGMIVPSIGYMMAARGPGTSGGGFWQVMAPVMAGLFFVGIPALIGCVIVGIVMLVMTFFARRSTGMHEIRASLASIDAQLRVLAMGREGDRQGK